MKTLTCRLRFAWMVDFGGAEHDRTPLIYHIMKVLG